MTKMGKGQASVDKEVVLPPEGGAETPLDNSIDDIAGALNGQQPEINQGVIDAENLDRQSAPEVAPAAPGAPGAPTSRGREKVTFNAEIHEVGPDGTPLLTPHGRFKRKKGLVKRVNVPQPGATPQHTATGADMLALGQAQNIATAKMVTDLKEALTVSLISKEWAMSKEEKDGENVALAATLNRYSPMGVPLNPLFVYAGLVAVNAGKRWNQPETKTFVQRMKEKAALWWLTRKQKKGSTDATQSHRGRDDVGENNSGNASA